MGRHLSIRHWSGLALVAALVTAGCASTRQAIGAGALAGPSPVAVSWQDPQGFSEPTWGAMPVDRGQWIRPLAEHLRRQAEPMLAPGERLEVELMDVNRAGEYEPGRSAAVGHDFRVVRDIYPPRIHLRFRHLAGSGAVIAEGERRLVDVGFMQRQSIMDSDPLRYEKRLLDDWLRRELGGR
ncbi:DUF3016 domain-containing protein [Aerolutibacter ruishenii]|uniref:DUF3016 family protein n=1 Tax=Aerolutibacter ruishenii TaxID=686800 RepID=A0A562M2X3_9GAMM|nr:DUF3016 domain-containing protein [Lysobacter ruishenii]TWI14128.1 Protein of unknown function (DUF3016) [Lysobacter ruishenii]